MIKVSIVVPIYNVAPYLDECLCSIQNQTLSDIEILCINDGSTDGSEAIIKKYVEMDSRFKCITKPNSGYGDTMNQGIKNSSGEYIGIVESDDYIEHDMFEKLYCAAIKNDCDVVKSDYFEFTTKNKKNQKYIKTVTDDSYYGVLLDHYKNPEIYHFRMNTWTGIYKTSFIKENSILHNTTPGAAYQDNGFWFQTLTLAKRILYIDGAFYHYRQDNPNSSINSDKKVYCMCDEYNYIEKLPNLKDYFDKQLMGIFLMKKYFNYMYTYKRIADKFKIDFLKRFGFEFKKSIDDGLFNVDSMGLQIYGVVQRIIDDPVKFYYDDTIWCIQHNISKNSYILNEYDKNIFYHILNKMRLI